MVSSFFAIFHTTFYGYGTTGKDAFELNLFYYSLLETIYGKSSFISCVVSALFFQYAFQAYHSDAVKGDFTGVLVFCDISLNVRK